ncbi:MAG: response regulator [Candidatus Magasanikbacteria bacterium]|nr:response regulator [Candidatus Magasanikbacteria bacterium]
MVNKRPTILFVEDENDLIDVYHLIFDNHGYRFLSTKNIDDAMMLCQTNNVDLVLLDILLPGAGGEIERLGFVFLERLKNNEETKNIPVIILTNLNSIRDKKQGLSLGANDYLAKSEKTPQEVLAKAERILNKNKKEK